MKVLRFIFVADSFWQVIWKTVAFWVLFSSLLLGLVELLFLPDIDYANNPTHFFPVWREIISIVVPFSYLATLLRSRLFGRRLGFTAFTDYLLIVALMLLPVFAFLSLFANS